MNEKVGGGTECNCKRQPITSVEKTAPGTADGKGFQSHGDVAAVGDGEWGPLFVVLVDKLFLKRIKPAKPVFLREISKRHMTYFWAFSHCIFCGNFLFYCNYRPTTQRLYISDNSKYNKNGICRNFW